MIVAIVAICCIVLSCKHKTDFESLPVVSYSTDISPIISGNCTFSGCHGTSNSEKFKLLTYDEVMRHCDIVANAPESSKLYSIIKSRNEETIMPRKPYSPLTEHQIILIFVWIGQGAKNN